MIILDLTNAIRHRCWPDGMPMKIRLIEGRHQLDYDVHPMARKTKWYLELVENMKKEYPSYREVPNDLPIGINKYQATKMNAGITEE